jgi:hypothetical protein
MPDINQPLFSLLAPAKPGGESGFLEGPLFHSNYLKKNGQVTSGEAVTLQGVAHAFSMRRNTGGVQYDVIDDGNIRESITGQPWAGRAESGNSGYK